MARRRVGSNGPRSREERPLEPFSPAELIVVAHPEARLRARPSGIAAAAASDANGLDSILKAHGAAMQPLFGVPEERLLAFAPAATDGPPEPGSPRALARYYRVDAPDLELDDLAKSLQAHSAIEAAYVKPPTTLAVMTIDALEANKLAEKVATQATLNDMQPDGGGRAAGDARLHRQPALPGPRPRRRRRAVSRGRCRAAAAPASASSTASGPGASTHEDLLQNQGGVVVGTAGTDTNHGTAVLGEISGDRNTFGITGIAPDAVDQRASFSDRPRRRPSSQAADKLGAGDIILLEIHRAGPGRNPAQGSSATSRSSGGPTTSPPSATPSQQGHDRRRGSGQRRPESRRPDLRHAGRRVSRRPGPTRSTAPIATPARSSSARGRRRPGPTAATTGRTARASTSPTTARASTPRAGAARSPPPGTATCRAARTRISGTPTHFCGTSSASPIVVGRARLRPGRSAGRAAACR